jgi:carboxymethylenebutenolidase
MEDLRKHPAVSGNELGTVGFSFGGYWALWLASQKPEAVRAVTIFYSTGEGDFQRSKAAFLGHFAETDPFEPEAGVKALEKSLRGANRPTTFYTYPGTGHWFFEKDRQDAYRAQAAQLAWERTIAFLHNQLGGKSD